MGGLGRVGAKGAQASLAAVACLSAFSWAARKRWKMSGESRKEPSPLVIGQLTFLFERTKLSPNLLVSGLSLNVHDENSISQEMNDAMRAIQTAFGSRIKCILANQWVGTKRVSLRNRSGGNLTLA